ncbi:stage III sporulation protein AA [Cytobacillus sp. Hm23]
MDEVYNVLPQSISLLLTKYSPSTLKKIEEIRVRVTKPLEVIIDGKPQFHPYLVTHEDGRQLLNKISQYSIYTLEEELRRGYITIEGGHRVGLAGKVITESGNVKAIRNVSSFNIRIAKQKIGVANHLTNYLYNNRWLNTIIIGPPQTGKTTLLRDITRLISLGIVDENIQSCKVGIVDERSEIAGSVNGIPQHDLGERVDILDACPKAEGMMMMIRSMSPDVLVVDEIGRVEDSEAILEAVNAGVRLFVTVHGYEWQDLKKRPSLRPILEMEVFDRFIELTRRNGPGTVSRVLNARGENIMSKVRVT